ncbi:unnamed protein product [Penicillium bialowiezense]
MTLFLYSILTPIHPHLFQGRLQLTPTHRSQMTSNNRPTGSLGSSEVDSLEGMLHYHFTDLRYLDTAEEDAGARSAAEDKKRIAQLGNAVIRLIYGNDDLKKWSKHRSLSHPRRKEA